MARRNVVLPFIILINIAVFMLWALAGPDLGQFMEDNFTVSWLTLSQGRYWTLLSSEFSHNFLLHLALNMFVLNSFGSLMESVLGPWRFLRFYLAAAAVASLGHVLVSAWVLGAPDLSAVGASGAIAGLVILFSLMFPREKILIFGILPVPAYLGAFVVVGLDLWGLMAQAEGGGLPIGHGAHLGGALAGALYYFFFLRKRWRKFLRRFEDDGE